MWEPASRRRGNNPYGDADGSTRMAVGRSLALLSALLLAGCSGGGGGGDGPDAALGSARLVVVDEAVRPLAGVEVALTRGGGAVAANATDASGAVVFAGLEPGAYVAEARKAGYDAARLALTVAAGAHEPPFAKLQLALQAGGLPFHNEFKFDGYIEASASGGNWGGIANYYPCFVMQTAGQPCLGNVTNDVSLVHVPSVHEMQRIPDWLQVEMVWDTNQAASPYLLTRIDISQVDNFLIDNSTEAVGPSPLLVAYPPEWMTAWGLGVNHSLELEAFHGGPQAVCDNDPTGGTNCVIAGVAVQQRFTWFLHVFYGHTPPEGWRFTSDGPPPPA